MTDTNILEVAQAIDQKIQEFYKLRRIHIVTDYQSGFTADEVGKRYGLSRQRVQQIAREAGVYKRGKYKQSTTPLDREEQPAH